MVKQYKKTRIPMKILLPTALLTVAFTAATFAQVPSFGSAEWLVEWSSFNRNTNMENGSTLIADEFGIARKAERQGNCPATVTDVNGNVYDVVQIGKQCWISKNLRTDKFSDGSFIPKIVNDTAWTNTTSPAWCYYDNNPSYDTLYGKLYNWYTTVDSRNVCPTGWHVPANADWTELTQYLGCGSYPNPCPDELYASGPKMKSVSGWNPPNEGATNESGFSALPGGVRSLLDLNQSGNTFDNLNNIGYWWSSSTETSTYAVNVALNTNYSQVYYANSLFNFGLSIRCLKDLPILGIFEKSIDVNPVNLYPNPTENQINVIADAKLIGSNYVLYDNTGKIVLSGLLTSENITIELGNLSGGVYLFRIADYLKQTIKVIKK
jgi:uncharacterized protein (TIGR02145 family)